MERIEPINHNLYKPFRPSMPSLITFIKSGLRKAREEAISRDVDKFEKSRHDELDRMRKMYSMYTDDKFAVSIPGIPLKAALKYYGYSWRSLAPSYYIRLVDIHEKYLENIRSDNDKEDIASQINSNDVRYLKYHVGDEFPVWIQLMPASELHKLYEWLDNHESQYVFYDMKSGSIFGMCKIELTEPNWVEM